MDDPTSLFLPFLIVGAVFMIIGVLFGLIAANMTGSKQKNETKNDGSQPAARSSRPGLSEAGRIWQDASGKLLLEVDEELFATRFELPRSASGRPVQVAVALRSWLGMGPGPSGPPAAEQAPSAARPVQLTAVPAPISRPSQAGGTTPPSLKVGDIAASVVGGVPAKKVVAPTPTTMVGQIDQILQEKLPGSPLRDRGIRLVELPGAGMQVIVGVEHFDSVADVTDPEVKALIQQCVAEWEKKYYPK